MNSSEYHQFVKEQRNLLTYGEEDAINQVQSKLKQLVKEAGVKQIQHDQACEYFQAYNHVLKQNDKLDQLVTQLREQLKFQRSMYEDQIKHMANTLQIQQDQIVSLQADVEDLEDAICIKNAQITSRNSIASQYEGIRRNTEDDLQTEVQRLNQELQKGKKLCVAMFQELQKKV